MDGKEFRDRGREMVDYMVDYLDNLESRRVTPQVEPGYLQGLLPREAPENPESWEDIMSDVESKIMIGVTHWQHPRFHAYFPAGNAYPSILGDMLGDAIGCVGFSWAASPACTELETIMLDWLGKMVGLPKEFLTNVEGSKGGGVIQSSASECVLDCLLAARAQSIQRLKNQHSEENVDETVLLSKLMAYCSKEAHSCVEKAAMISFVKLRILEPDENCSLRGETLKQAMEEDVANGMVPFFVSTTLGTTGCCAFDKIDEIGPVCKEYGAWLHVDGAYGGNSFICPEFQYLMKGIEYASSFNMNPNKWMLVNFDCSLMWVKDRYKLTQALVVDPLYLQHSYSECAIDYRHWGIPLSRRFRSLKLWFVIRNYGVSGLQAYIREHCRLAKRFEALVRTDDRFAVCNKVMTGLVCFRLLGECTLNQKLLSNINASGLMHMVPASVQDKFVIRFCVCAPKATDEDIDYAWETIARFATELIGSLDADGKPLSTSAGKSTEEYGEENDDSVSADDVKRKQDLQYKRSFFVRMVSDPKIYNPKIVSSESQYSLGSSEDSEGDAGKEASAEGGASEEEKKHHHHNAAAKNASDSTADNATPPHRKQPSKRTWISWPLAFILKSAAGENNSTNPANRRNEDVALLAEKEVSMRFRNWNTRLTIAPSATSSQGSSPGDQKRTIDGKEVSEAAEDNSK